MSAVTSSEVPMKSGVFRHVNQQMFTIGCGQSLAKRWLSHEPPRIMVIGSARWGEALVLPLPTRSG